ncbi:helix-turn-helix transcriptional regulator [Aerococcaceae bacterium NML191219]|nr:helix-turn-helix transcriptional regulator [Aerococcaceae bacterium NML191219]
MSEQHKTWAQEAKEKMKEKGWRNADLAKIFDVSRTTISELFKYGKGSDNLKRQVSRRLGVKASWKAPNEE